MALISLYLVGEAGIFGISWGLEGNSSTEMASHSCHRVETATLQAERGRKEFRAFAGPKS